MAHQILELIADKRLKAGTRLPSLDSSPRTRRQFPSTASSSTLFVILMSVGEEAVLTALARSEAKLGLIFLDMKLR